MTFIAGNVVKALNDTNRWDKMKKENLRIVYMGTPDFAVAPLRKLVENDFSVVGVITVADKPAGRGRKIRMSPVKIYAESNNIPVLQPTNLKDESFIQELRNLNADLQIVVAFRMLPEVVWTMPRKGTFNLHASLLPNYRGAAPINWAIINGDSSTGVSTFFLKHEIDTGNILLQKEIEIKDEDDAGSLHDKLMVIGADLVTETVDKLIENNLSEVPQNELQSPTSTLKDAPKLFKEDCKINFNSSTDDVYNFIRGLSPYPAAHTRITLQNGEDKALKIFKVEKLKITGDPGKIMLVEDQLIAFTLDGAVRILELQMEGKKRMKTEDFLRGVRL